MNTIDTLAELQEKYNKLQHLTAGLLSDVRDIQVKFLGSMAEYECDLKKGVITDTEFMLNGLEAYKHRDRQLSQVVIRWESQQP